MTFLPNPQQIKFYVQTKFPNFGINKQQEIIRLLFEIGKKERRHFKEILNCLETKDQPFQNIKQYLLKRRYPGLTSAERKLRHSMPHLTIDPSHRLNVQKTKKNIIPKKFLIEKSVAKTPLIRRLRKKYPKARYEEINTYKEFINQKTWGIEDYNDRLKHFFIVREKFQFFLPCPCSPKAVSCDYQIFNLGYGCAFECVYCFLQGYTNSPGILIPANIEDFFKNFQPAKKNIRLGTGQFTDSLVFDHITEYSPLIINFFRNHPKCTFEFKTKSNNIQLLTSTPSADNIVVSWTLNPQKIIETTEFYSSSLRDRLKAATECLEAGYRVGFHFDPIIYYDSWEKDYQALVERLFDMISSTRIAWISLGTLRMPTHLKQVIENRFPENTVLDGELISKYDKKLRYPWRVRKEIYEKMKGWIRQKSKKVTLYLCMEEKSMFNACKLAVVYGKD